MITLQGSQVEEPGRGFQGELLRPGTKSRFEPTPGVFATVALLALAAPLPARAEWPAFGRAVTAAGNNQVHSAIASDGADGAIVTWQDFRFPRVNVFARHVLDTGELDARWPADGQALLVDTLAAAASPGGQVSPVIVADGAGGAIVAWLDFRSDETGADIFAQHILGSGVVDPAWPANGVPVVAVAGQQDNLVMVSDAAAPTGSTAGVIVAWMDTRRGPSEVDLFAQHVLPTGVVDPRWPVDGLAVCTAAGRQEFPAMAADGAGGAIVAWGDARSAATDLDIFAQHVLGSGVVDPAWPVNGRALCTASGGQSLATIASDRTAAGGAASGAIVAWGDARVSETSHIFAQHVLGLGVVDPAWPVNGVAVSGAATFEGRPLAVADGAGGAIVNWVALVGHVNLFAQHVRAAGVVDPAWPSGGRALSISDRDQTRADIVPDGRGGAIMAWDEGSDVIAQHVFASGALDPAFPATGRPISNLPSNEGDAALVATSGSGAIVSWTDGRNGKDTDIYAMQVLEASTVSLPGSGPSDLAFLSPTPNPARSALTLRFVLPRAERVRLAVYDVGGRCVRELARGALPAGEQAIAWDLRDQLGAAVGAGLYIARLEAGGRSFTRRLVAVR